MERFDDAKEDIQSEQEARRRQTMSYVSKTSPFLRSSSRRTANSQPTTAADTKRVARSVFHKDVKSSFARRHAEAEEEGTSAGRGDSEYSSTLVAIKLVEKKTRAMKLHAVANRFVHACGSQRYLL